MGTSQKNLSNHSFKYKLSFHANKKATYCSWELWEKPQLEEPGPGGRGRDTTQDTAPASLFKRDWIIYDCDPGVGQASFLLGRIRAAFYLKVQGLRRACYSQPPESNRKFCSARSIGVMGVQLFAAKLIQ